MSSHILVPFDNSDPASRALEYTVEEFPDAKITVLTVIAQIGSIDCSDQVSIEEEADCFSAEAKQRLQEAREIAEEYGSAIRTATDVGPPCRVITEYATTEDIDQIVIGSHGRTGISRIIVGSIAETVVRRASSPVTIIQ